MISSFFIYIYFFYIYIFFSCFQIHRGDHFCQTSNSDIGDERKSHEGEAKPTYRKKSEKFGHPKN